MLIPRRASSASTGTQKQSRRRRRRSPRSAHGPRSSRSVSTGLPQILDRSASTALAGALFDLGVSSPQLDTPDRGFSYRFDAPLDMRMDRSQGMTAADVVNEAPRSELARLFNDHGEDTLRPPDRGGASRRPAPCRDGDAGRGRQLGRPGGRPPSRPPGQKGVPGPTCRRQLRARGPARRHRRGHRAARAGGPHRRHLLPLGRRQGGERTAAHAATGGCACPPGLPCVCGAVARVRLLNRGRTKAIGRGSGGNPRRESARLRAAEALATAENRLYERAVRMSPTEPGWATGRGQSPIGCCAGAPGPRAPGQRENNDATSIWSRSRPGVGPVAGAYLSPRHRHRGSGVPGSGGAPRADRRKPVQAGQPCSNRRRPSRRATRSSVCTWPSSRPPPASCLRPRASSGWSSPRR